MRWLKVRLRTQMILVAVVGAGLAWHREAEKRERRFWTIAFHEALRAIAYRGYGCQSRIELEPVRAPIPFNPRKMAYHRRLSERYLFAARYPWLPVLPDPPEPE
jgi:hypothetical protein